ncbi:MAG TPA: DNA polymerase III subunit gamma/tau [Candidatus Saccharimonadales bacterium]
MGQALYRTHRPKKLGDIVGQEHITTALSHALEKGTISHAYLFTGPRGTGKTTIARILAHEINGLPYDEDGATYLDIIEIDAASNRRIDEIRDLRDKVNLAPAVAKFKVYIIDEVHMLTREAFNALLKTLEEPPAHVVFILATTEVNKLPETIISRTQHYTFRLYDLGVVAAHLREMAEAEKISITDDALALIAEHGEGSFRDSISLLDQLRNQADEVTLADVQSSLGIAPAEAVQTLVASMQAHDAAGVAVQLKDLHEHGYEPSHLAKQLAGAVREALIAKKPVLPSDVSLQLLAQLVAVPASPDPRVALEIAVLDATFAGETVAAAVPKPKTSAAEVHVKPAKMTEPHPSSFTKKLAEEQTKETPQAEVKIEESVQATKEVPAPHNASAMQNAQSKTSKAEETLEEDDGTLASNATLTTEQWAEVLAALKKHSTLYGIIRAASAGFEPGKIVLTSAFAFHQKRLKEPKNREIIAQTIQEITGEAIRIECLVGEVSTVTPDLPPALPPSDEVVHAVAAPAPQTETPTPPANEAKPNDTVSTVSNIFGGAELLQS